jgi:hypothetical protein
MLKCPREVINAPNMLLTLLYIVCSCMAFYQGTNLLTGQVKWKRLFSPKLFNNNAMLVTTFPFVFFYYFTLVFGLDFSYFQLHFFFFGWHFCWEVHYVVPNVGKSRQKNVLEKERKFKCLFLAPKVSAWGTPITILLMDKLKRHYS